MSTRQDYVTSIEYLVSGTRLPVGQSEKEKAIAQASKEHSKYRPKTRVADVTGVDTFEYKCSTYLTYWKDGFSSIKTIEYPINDDDETPDMILDESMLRSYRKPDGEYFRFLEDSPDTDEEFRVNYTAPHVIDDIGSSVDYTDEEAFEMLAASYLCQMIAAAYSMQGDPTINADSVNHKTKAGEYRRQASEYRALYFTNMGIKEGENAPSVAFVDWDKPPSWQSDRMTHPKRYR